LSRVPEKEFVMFTRIAAALVAASVMAAPALAGSVTVIKSTPSGAVKVVKHKHHARHFHGKHVKVVKIVRPHRHHHAHVAHNTRVIVKSVRPAGRI
jgi:hypothetical protein